MTARRTLSNPRAARRRAPAPTAVDLQRVVAQAKESARLARAAVAELRRVADAQVRLAESHASLARELLASSQCVSHSAVPVSLAELLPSEIPVPAPRWRRWLRALARWRK